MNFKQLMAYLDFKKGKITKEEYFNEISILPKLVKDYNNEKIYGTVYYKSISINTGDIKCL